MIIIACYIYIYISYVSTFLDMSGNVYTLGRAETCDIVLNSNIITEPWLNVMSKVHFRIYRECISNTNETVVYLEDMSSNGTFVDRILVGNKKRVILDNNSEISLAKSELVGNYRKIYYGD